MQVIQNIGSPIVEEQKMKPEHLTLALYTFYQLSEKNHFQESMLIVYKCLHLLPTMWPDMVEFLQRARRSDGEKRRKNCGKI